MDEQLLVTFAVLEERHWWFLSRRRIVEDALDRYVSSETQSVLDVGCGTGGFINHLAGLHENWSIRGVEPSHGAASHAVKSGCSVEVGTFESLPAEDSSVDALTALDVIEHCEDDAAACLEAMRVLRPGGYFLLTVPALPSLWSQHDVDNRHFRRYTTETLRRPLQSAGFDIVRVTYFNSLLLPVAYVSRWFSRLTGSRKALGMGLPPAPLNELLRRTFLLEAGLLRTLDLPVGMSLLALCRKREG